MPYHPCYLIRETYYPGTEEESWCGGPIASKTFSSDCFMVKNHSTSCTSELSCAYCNTPLMVDYKTTRLWWVLQIKSPARPHSFLKNAVTAPLTAHLSLCFKENVLLSFSFQEQVRTEIANCNMLVWWMKIMMPSNCVEMSRCPFFSFHIEMSITQCNKNSITEAFVPIETSVAISHPDHYQKEGKIKSSQVFL